MSFDFDAHVVAGDPAPRAGAGTAGSCQAATGQDWSELRYFRRRPSTVAGVEIDVTRTGYTGDRGYELWIPRDGALAVWDRLFDVGVAYGPQGQRVLLAIMTRSQADDPNAARPCAVGSPRDERGEPRQAGHGDVRRTGVPRRRGLQREVREPSAVRREVAALRIDRPCQPGTVLVLVTLEVPSTQPRVRVTLDKYNPALQQAFEAVPLPETAKPAAGWDKHLVVWQIATDTMWEFWALSRKTDGWHAGWGAKIVRASQSIGVLPSPLGATATGLPLLGGLITLDDLRRGHIDHALAEPPVGAACQRRIDDRLVQGGQHRRRTAVDDLVAGQVVLLRRELLEPLRRLEALDVQVDPEAQLRGIVERMQATVPVGSMPDHSRSRRYSSMKLETSSTTTSSTRSWGAGAKFSSSTTFLTAAVRT